MNKTKPKQKFPIDWIVGLVLGFIMPVIGVYIALEARPELAGIQRFDSSIVKQVNVEIITLGMLINAGLFFLFIRFNRDSMSRGILVASVVDLIVIFIYRFLL